ncbi:MAG: uridine kinase family protein [Fastidiosipilaceae bacterium]|jgi:uridine kinase
MAKHPEMQYYSVSEIESRLGSVRMDEFVRSSEEDFLQKMSDIAAAVAWSDKVKVIFISGPTSSGKTTSTNRLAGALGLRGKHAVKLSLDDYYIDFEKPKVVNGWYDFENPETLDLDMIRDDIERLLDGGTVNPPHFNFKERRREWHGTNELSLKNDDVLLVEGLHGLSSHVAGHLDPDLWYGIMLRPWATIATDRTLLTARDIRMMRRISRDAHSRNTSALATIDYWPMLDQTEDRFFPEYTERADVFINTCVAYEFCIIPHLAAEQIEKDLELLERAELPPSLYVEPPLEYVDLEAALEQANHLLRASKKLPYVTKRQVPRMSILNEFIN